MYTKRDSKIRCYLFSCVAAMIYLRRLEIKLASAGINHTAEDVMDDMQHLHSMLALNKGARKPIRRLETPTKTQSEVLSALGHLIDGNGRIRGTSYSIVPIRTDAKLNWNKSHVYEKNALSVSLYQQKNIQLYFLILTCLPTQKENKSLA